MSANQPRQPRGVPTGGQWRATNRPEGSARITVPATDRASVLWALVGRLERGEEHRLVAEVAKVANHDAYSAAQLADDIRTAKDLRSIAQVLDALDEIGAVIKVDAHGECSCSDGHCPGYDPPRSPTEREMEELAYQVLRTLESRATEEADYYRQQRPWGGPTEPR